VQRTFGKEFHRVTDIANAKDNSVAQNTLILRNYNDGRQGGWNNYCCYKDQGTQSKVKVHGKTKDTGKKSVSKVQAEEVKAQ